MVVLSVEQRREVGPHAVAAGPTLPRAPATSRPGCHRPSPVCSHHAANCASLHYGSIANNIQKTLCTAMTDDSVSLSSLFSGAETKRRKLDQLPSANAPEYQDLLGAAIADYTHCLRVADGVSLFSSNESLDDVSTSDIR